jgi:CO/xanthine dehydrogenase FAD-binding subunit
MSRMGSRHERPMDDGVFGRGGSRRDTVSDMEFLAPGNMQELGDALRLMTPDSRFLAGGTDVVRRLNEGSLTPDRIVDLSGVPELRFVRQEAGRLHIGSATTLALIQREASISRFAGCLAEAAATVGSRQIRNVATIGGSVANASPCGDILPALLVLDSVATVLDPAGVTRQLPVTALLGAPGVRQLKCGEVITGFEFPALGPDEHSTFTRVASRSTFSVARLSMAIVVTCAAPGGRLRNVRVALGAVGTAAFRDDVLQRFLEGRRADSATSALFAEECTAAIRRAIPDRPSLPYKQSAVRGLACDALAGLGVFLSPSGDVDEPQSGA